MASGEGAYRVAIIAKIQQMKTGLGRMCQKSEAIGLLSEKEKTVMAFKIKHSKVSSYK